MGYRLSPQADSDLDGIWYYVASKSGSVETADRLIDSITGRFFLLANHPNIGRSRDEVCGASP
jgi:plasmid stabilization system protein ParE